MIEDDNGLARDADVEPVGVLRDRSLRGGSELTAGDSELAFALGNDVAGCRIAVGRPPILGRLPAPLHGADLMLTASS